MLMDDRPLRLPPLYTEEEAAKALGISIDTMRRERKAGNIGHTMIGGRPRYTEPQLIAYIDRKTVPPCKNTESATTGYLADPTQNNGAARGSISERDRHAAHLSALKTLRPPGRGSPNGSH